jgi:hypothetical protein
MRGSKWLAVAITVGFVSTGVAVAGSRSSETTQVQGTFHAIPVKEPKQRQCDKNHVRIQATFRGSQTSEDEPRLEGDLEIKVESVINTDNGWGRTSGSVVLRRSRHGRVKFRGEFVGVVEPDNGAEGFVTGRTFGRRPVRLFANFNSNQDIYTGAISGEFGTDSQVEGPYAPHEDQDPAVLTDACFDHHH